LLSQGLQKEIKWHISPAITKHIVMVSQNFLSFIKGGPCRSKRLPYRLVAGVWTLAAFIFVQAYTSTLFTYVVTRDANQRTANQICLRRYWQWRHQFTCTGIRIYEYFIIGKKKKMLMYLNIRLTRF
jgi:hypothetical protein